MWRIKEEGSIYDDAVYIVPAGNYVRTVVHIYTAMRGVVVKNGN